MVIGSKAIGDLPIGGKPASDASGWAQVPAGSSSGWTRSPVPSEGVP